MNQNANTNTTAGSAEDRKGRKAGFIPSCLILVAVLSACDYFLFREFELVWPFFWFPYVILMILYIRDVKKAGKKPVTLMSFLIHALVILPVFAGLIMSIGWMIKNNFWGEIAGRILNR